MTKEKWLAVLLVWLAVDVSCLAIGKPQSSLYGFGVRGLVIDFVLGVIVLGLYIRGDKRS